MKKTLFFLIIVISVYIQTNALILYNFLFPQQILPLSYKTSHGVNYRLQFSTNKEAYHEYEIEEKIEAGIVLRGSEVKSCRRGTVQLSDGIAEIRDGEIWLLNVHIAEFDRCDKRYQHQFKRSRKLLLHYKEILKLEQRVLQRNCYIIPTRMYFSEKNIVKVELGIGKKKNLIDKRDDSIRKDGEREVRRVMKSSSYD